LSCFDYLLGHGFCSVQVEYLPVVYPSLSEQSNPTRFCERVGGFCFHLNLNF
jgi:hypothetical protein